MAKVHLNPFINRQAIFLFHRAKAGFKWWVLAVIVALQACDVQLPVGLDFVETEPLHVFNIDTLTVKFSTVHLDTLVTDNSERLLVGNHKDTLLGVITSKSFFLLGNDSLKTPDQKYSSYEGAFFRLYYDDYWYYDTTKSVSLSLYLLSEELKLDEETDQLYNTSDFKYDSAEGLLGNIDFIPKPHREYVEFAIDYNFGDSLFRFIVNEEEFITSDNDFYKKYKGFVLGTISEGGPFLGFSTASSLVLKYTEAGEDKELIFSIAENLHFNQIIDNKSGSLVASLATRRNSLSAEKTGNMAFMRSGAPLGIRVEFPYLHNLLTLSKNIYISEAYLIVAPVYHSGIQYQPYPSTFSVFSVDKLNRENAQLDVAPVLYLDKEYKEETFYRFSVASFLNEQLELGENRENALLLKMPEDLLNNSISTLFVGNHENAYGSELKILVLTLDQEGY